MSVVCRHDGRVHNIHDRHVHDGPVYSGSVEYTRRSCPYYAGTTVVSVTSTFVFWCEWCTEGCLAGCGCVMSLVRRRWSVTSTTVMRTTCHVRRYDSYQTTAGTSGHSPCRVMPAHSHLSTHVSHITRAAVFIILSHTYSRFTAPFPGPPR